MASTQVNRWWLRLSLVLLTAALLLLAISVWSALQTRGHHNRVAGITLTFTRIAQLVAETTADNSTTAVYSGDQLARLIAEGDVQINSMATSPRGGLHEQVANAINSLAAQWQQVRNGFGVINRQVVITTTAHNSSAIQNAMPTVTHTFDSLFDAILNESLSKTLLALASTIRADLGSLQYVLANGAQPAAVQSLLSGLDENIRQLRTVANPVQGPALLGYSASGQMNNFVQAFNDLNAPVMGSAIAEMPQSRENISAITSTALEYAQGVLRTVDVELHKQRRNVLIALCLSCLCVLFCTMFAWLQRRAPADTGKQDNTVELLEQELTLLTDGRLNHHSRVAKDNAANKSLADLIDYTAAMFRSLVNVSRGVGRNTNQLALAQQQVAESLIERGVQHREQLSVQVSALRQCASVLDNTANESVPVQSGGLPESIIEPVTGAASALAGLSAQLEVGIGRIDRARTLTRELSSVVTKIENTSHQSNLHALNESIKLSSYYDAADENDEFAQKTQSYSRQLQAAAASALQQTRDIHTDLEACNLALRECAGAVEESAKYSLKATQALKSHVPEIAPDSTNRAAVADVVEHLLAVVDTLDTSLDVHADEENLLSLKGYALELQLVAAKLSESLMRFDVAESDHA